MRAAWAASLGCSRTRSAPEAPTTEAAPPAAEPSAARNAPPAWEEGLPVAATASFVPEIPASSAARRATCSRLMSFSTVTVSRGSMRWAGRAHGSSLTIQEITCSRR